MIPIGTLYGVGVGPGDPELLTLKGLRILQSVPTVYVPVSRPGARSYARTIVDAYLDPGRQRIADLVVEMHDDEGGLAEQWRANARVVGEGLIAGFDAAYITEGDPLLYSTFIHLADALAEVCPEAPIVVVPGISSVHAAAAAARIELAERDGRVAILPATYEGDKLGVVLDTFDTIVLLKVASVFDQVLDLLEERGLADGAVYVRRCGRPEEEIVTDVRTLRGCKLDYFSLLIVPDAIVSPGHVYFIGAGPGAPDLLTLRGRALLELADVVIYADSLVDERICAFARPDAEILGSSSLTLEEIMEQMVNAARSGKIVARLQSGDPAIYGAIHEQITRLDAAGVPWTIVPGVSSAFAAAAVLGVELTVPEVAQTVIMTRISGRASPVPPAEELRGLAAHHTSLVLFLSITHILRVVQELLDGGYPPETPVAVVYRVSWPDELVLRGTLADIRPRVRDAKLTRQALILVGPALAGPGSESSRRSRLYSADHSHLFREPSGPTAAVSDGASRET